MLLHPGRSRPCSGTAPPRNHQTDTSLRNIHAQTTVAEVIASMVPCARLYAFLGCSLAAAFPGAAARGNPYADWITMYSSFEYGVSQRLHKKFTAASQRRWRGVRLM